MTRAIPLPPAPPHGPLEDVHALLLGSSFVAFGLVLLKADGLVTGGLAGVALIVAYASGWPIGFVFIGINVPFFLFAQRRLGWEFTLRSAATMGALAGFTTAMPYWLTLTTVHPTFASIFGGSMIGVGVLSLARHRASVGGIGILALYLQTRRGVSAGLFSMAVDVAILGAALIALGPRRLAYSAVSAVALNLVMIAYHRPGRYAGR